MSMKLGIVAEFYDRASKRMNKMLRFNKKLERSQKRQAKTGKGNARNLTRAARAQTKLTRALNATRRAAQNSFRAVANGAKMAGRAVAALHRKTVRLGKFGVKNIKGGVGKVARGVGLAVGIAASVASASALAAGVLVGTAAKFEKFQTILETMEGSSAKAKVAMAWVADFAVKTPYELDTVMDSFVRLRTYGLDPTNGMLTTLGDTAAAMGRPIMDTVEAFADALTGENERLKSFGITASKSGKTITYTYTNALGKTVKASVRAGDRLAIQAKLMEIWGSKYGGAMDKLSQTWEGMTSNFADQWMKLQLMIMNAGLFDWMKSKLKSVLDQINKMEADGTLKKWAEKIGNTIQTVLTQTWDFAQKTYTMISKLNGYLQKAADYVGGWENLGIILAGFVFGPALVATAAGLIQIATGLAALSTALLANPVGLAIAAIAGGVYLIYDNWDAMEPYFGGIWNAIQSGVETTWNFIKSLFDWSPMDAISSAFGGIGDKIGGYINSAADMAGSAWQRLKNVFTDDSAVNIAVRDPASIERAEAATKRLKIALESTSAVDMSGVSKKLAGLIASASALFGAVKQAVSKAENYLWGVSWHSHGVRMMDTLAAGMKARSQVVVDQIKATMQQVRNHLPSSPAKIGPLSDIHQLKFSETIARSIKPGPMVKAMRAAALATMAAAVPSAPAIASPGVASPSLAALSASAGSGTTGGAIHIEFKPTINVGAGSSVTKDEIMSALREQVDQLVKLVEGKQKENARLKF